MFAFLKFEGFFFDPYNYNVHKPGAGGIFSNLLSEHFEEC